MIGAILSILDTTIVNVALDTLSRDLHRRWPTSSGWRPATCSPWPRHPVSGGRGPLRRRAPADRLRRASRSARRSRRGLVAGRSSPSASCRPAAAAMIMSIGRWYSARGRPRPPRPDHGRHRRAMILAVFGLTIGGLIIDDLDSHSIFYVDLPSGQSRRDRHAPAAERRGGRRARAIASGSRCSPSAYPLVVYGLAEISQSGRSPPRPLAPWSPCLPSSRLVLHALRVAEPLLDVRLFRASFSARRPRHLRPRRQPLRRDDHHAAEFQLSAARSRDESSARPTGHRRGDRDAARRRFATRRGGRDALVGLRVTLLGAIPSSPFRRTPGTCSLGRIIGRAWASA